MALVEEPAGKVDQLGGKYSLLDVFLSLCRPKEQLQEWPRWSILRERGRRMDEEDEERCSFEEESHLFYNNELTKTYPRSSSSCAVGRR